VAIGGPKGEAVEGREDLGVEGEEEMRLPFFLEPKLEWNIPVPVRGKYKVRDLPMKEGRGEPWSLGVWRVNI